MAAHSDPERDPNFRRRWSGPPLTRRRPPTGGTVKRAKFETLSSNRDNSELARILQWASRLDRVADMELHLGHHMAAEQLSRRAAELREALR